MELTPFSPLKLLRHAPRVEASIRGEVVYPISVELDLSNICNHGCPWCSFNGFRQENWKSFDDARLFKLIYELQAVGVKSITFTGGGEPLVHKRAADVMELAYNCGIEFGVVTNGRKLEGLAADIIAAYAKFVRVSLDAGTTQTHQLLHATAMPEYVRILENMRRVVTLAKDNDNPITVGASFCVFDVNVEEIGRAAERVKATGANYLEVRPVFPTEWRGGGFGNPLTGLLVDEARGRLEMAKDQHNDDHFKVIGMIHRFDQVGTDTKRYQKCHIGPLTTIINADGYIYHCCQTRGLPDFRAGSILDKPFAEVWMNAQHLAMIDAIDVTKCPPCRYDGYNEIIEQAFEGDALHGNFI